MNIRRKNLRVQRRSNVFTAEIIGRVAVTDKQTLRLGDSVEGFLGGACVGGGGVVVLGLLGGGGAGDGGMGGGFVRRSGEGGCIVRRYERGKFLGVGCCCIIRRINRGNILGTGGCIVRKCMRANFYFRGC